VGVANEGMRVSVGVLLAAGAALVISPQPVRPDAFVHRVWRHVANVDQLREWGSARRSDGTRRRSAAARGERGRSHAQPHSRTIRPDLSWPARWGGSVVRQLDRGATVSLFGTLYEGIAIEVDRNSAGSCARHRVGSGRGADLGGPLPELLILPLDAGDMRWSIDARQ